jgi:hypothetical protein
VFNSRRSYAYPVKKAEYIRLIHKSFILLAWIHANHRSMIESERETPIETTSLESENRFIPLLRDQLRVLSFIGSEETASAKKWSSSCVRRSKPRAGKSFVTSRALMGTSP